MTLRRSTPVRTSNRNVFSYYFFLGRLVYGDPNVDFSWVIVSGDYDVYGSSS